MDILVVGSALRGLFRKKFHALPGCDTALGASGPSHIQIITADQAAGKFLEKVMVKSFPDTRKKAGEKMILAIAEIPVKDLQGPIIDLLGGHIPGI